MSQRAWRTADRQNQWSAPASRAAMVERTEGGAPQVRYVSVTGRIDYIVMAVPKALGLGSVLLTCDCRSRCARSANQEHCGARPRLATTVGSWFALPASGVPAQSEALS